MAVFNCNFFSTSLQTEVMFHVILPNDHMSNEDREIKRKYKTLYLLHGMYGNYNDWLYKSRLCLYAEEYKICVVLISGENKFYRDIKETHDLYSSYILEILKYTRSTFPLSTKYQDTFLGGLSMGGYGALINGIKYHDYFSNLILLSSALIKENIVSGKDRNIIYKDTYNLLFNIKSPKDFTNSESDYEYMIKEMLKTKSNIPTIYMACGKNDHLFRENNEFYQLLQDIKYPKVKYDVLEGVHDWYFWDKTIKLGIKYILNKKK